MRAPRTLDSRTLGLVLSLSLLALSQAAAAGELTDVAAAKTKAAASSKNILIDFSAPA